MGFIYLGSPYTHENSEVMDKRYEVVERYAAYLLNEGRTVYSPITHCHPMACKYVMPRNFDFWMEHDFAMIKSCSEFYRLLLPGWEKSRGLISETAFFRGLYGNRMLPVSVTKEQLLEQVPTLTEDFTWLEEHS